MRLIALYGELLSVRELADVFKYPSASAVRRANAKGCFPIKLGSFPDRKGLFATATSVAAALSKLDECEAVEKATCLMTVELRNL